MTGDLVLRAPLTGWAASLDEVPDAVFAERLLGDGLAIEPTEGVLTAPCDAVVISVHAARHAISLRAAGGVEILRSCAAVAARVGLGDGVPRGIADGEGAEAIFANLQKADVPEGDRSRRRPRPAPRPASSP